jgi:hypothetical protein
VKGFRPLGIAPPYAIPIELEMGAGLGNAFSNLTRILGEPDVDGLSPVGTQALLPHYTLFGLLDVERGARLKIFGPYN